jgi:hypothetical protein
VLAIALANRVFWCGVCFVRRWFAWFYGAVVRPVRCRTVSYGVLRCRTLSYFVVLCRTVSYFSYFVVRCRTLPYFVVRCFVRSPACLSYGVRTESKPHATYGAPPSAFGLVTTYLQITPYKENGCLAPVRAALAEQPWGSIKRNGMPACLCAPLDAGCMRRCVSFPPSSGSTAI